MKARRKDFERIARIVKETQTTNSLEKRNLALEFSALLSENNATFDADNFLHACGVQ